MESNKSLPTNANYSINNLENAIENSTLYYGVYTPNENKDTFNPSANVFQDKVEALKLAKKNKKSRFKSFQFYHEAAEFAMNGSECPNNNTCVEDRLFTKNREPEPSLQPIGEKSSPFKGPKPQELVELRKAIENGKYKIVEDTIWQNPRYLVSSGDTPSILQEGPRYNALHVAAKANNTAITELILSTISNVDFIKLLYGDNNQKNAEDRARILLDLYLNTPNKGLNETPLHFASKYGAVGVVEILVSYPQCDKTLKNKFNKTADEVICERADGDTTADKKRIALLLQQSYYVPVLRSTDNSLPPIVGEPFSPTEPLVLNTTPLSPRLEIHAYAGPMYKDEAQKFRRVWKTPPRSLKFSSPVSKNKSEDIINISALRFKDPEKGLERVGSKLADEFEISWKEYWPFLNTFVDISSKEGLELLENHLSRRNTKIKEIETSKESVKTPPVTKSEVISPISSLCSAFVRCKLSDSLESDASNQAESCDKNEFNPVFYIDKACQVFSNRISNDILYILCSEYNNIAPVLETEIKQLELLILSYMDDNRFFNVNFKKIHARLGALVANKLCQNIKEDSKVFLCEKLESLLETIIKGLDCFSSDDEANPLKITKTNKKPTLHKKQLICLLYFILNIMTQNCDTKIDLENEDECMKDWNLLNECLCVYHVRKSKKNNLSRNGSLKNKSRFEGENISRKLFVDEEEFTNEANQNNINNSLNENLEDSSDEEFYTPPSSPSFLSQDSDSEGEFNDTELPKIEVYIEGECPSKSDLAVFKALKYSKCVLNKKTHPNVYRWHHNVSLYSENEMEGWPSPTQLLKTAKLKQIKVLTNSWSGDEPPHCSTPSKSWLRITGANSPLH